MARSRTTRVKPARCAGTPRRRATRASDAQSTPVLVKYAPLVEQPQPLRRFEREGVHHLVRVADGGVDRLDLVALGARQEAADDEEARRVGAHHRARLAHEHAPRIMLRAHSQRTHAHASLTLRPLGRAPRRPRRAHASHACVQSDHKDSEAPSARPSPPRSRARAARRALPVVRTCPRAGLRGTFVADLCR